MPTPRRLVWFSDGTWSRPDQRHPTNIAKLAGLVEINDRQIVHYDAGVGTGWPRVAGGMFGTGIVDNILEAYGWLRKRYRPGDWILFNAFSRGASTVREAAALLGAVGFDDPDMPLRDVWRRYRSMYRTTRPIPVRAVAVYDTVGARGVPAGGGRWALAPQFDDCNLGAHVEYGFQALALDERRNAYSPCLWTNEAEHGRIQQTWFKGWHSDVGGGVGDTGLSDISLSWMISNLTAFAGLTLRDGWRQQLHPDANAPVHPAGWLTRLYGTSPRRLPAGAVIHHTAEVPPE